MNRRGFLKSILAAGVAPYVVTAAGVLMPVRTLWTPYSIVAGMRAFQIEANAAANITLSAIGSIDGVTWFDLNPLTAAKPDEVRYFIHRAMLKGTGLVRFGYDLTAAPAAPASLPPRPEGA